VEDEALAAKRAARSAEAGGNGGWSAPKAEAAVRSPASSRFLGGRWVLRSDGSISRSQFRERVPSLPEASDAEIAGRLS
jgi:hypothetical protein